MARPRLLVTRQLPAPVLARIRRSYDAELDPSDRRLEAAQLLERSRGCDAILCAPGDPLGSETVSRLPARIRAIATFSVGTDHIDLDAARARRLAVFHTPDVLTQATAEIAMLLMLGAARRAYEGQTLLRSGRWTGWAPTQLLGRGLSGRRLGILGMGRIGRAVAKRARAFDMEVHYSSRRQLASELECDARFHREPDDLLAHSDVLSLHVPASAEMRGFLCAERIERLPVGAIVVNTARGSLVDDDALVAALRCGRVAAAGLDVFEGEPALHPGYATLDNAYLLPHLGSATLETRCAMGHRALDNLDAFFAGREPPHRVV